MAKRDGYEIKRVSLKINDERIEKAFRADSIEKSVQQYRYGFAVGLFLYASFYIVDQIFIRHSYIELPMFRFGIVIPIMFICFLSTFLQIYRQIAPAINMLGIMIGGMGIVMMSLYTDSTFGTVRILGGLFIVLFSLYAFFSINYRDALTVGVILQTVYLMLLIFVKEGNSELIYMQAYFLSATNIIGGSVAYMLEKQRKREYLLRQSLSETMLKDALTGLYNRHYFNQFLVEDIEEFIMRSKAVRHVERRLGDIKAAKYGLIILDIDHFKRVNDTFGHSSGDLVLKQFAALLQANVRQSDDVLRYGGEEFLLVLKLTTEEYLKEFLVKIRNKIENHDFVMENGQRIGCTASMGMVVVPNDLSDEVSDLVRYADMALYKSKERGRNRAHRVYKLQGEVEYEMLR